MHGPLLACGRGQAICTQRVGRQGGPPSRGCRRRLDCWGVARSMDARIQGGAKLHVGVEKAALKERPKAPAEKGPGIRK